MPLPRYEKVEQQKQGMKKAAELERRFAKKDGATGDGAAADGAAASSDSDSDQDDEDKITQTEEAGGCLPFKPLCISFPMLNRYVALLLLDTNMTYLTIAADV